MESVGEREGEGESESEGGREGAECEGEESALSPGVCDLVFIIPLQAARRAMAAVVGFSIYHKNPGRPA